MISSLFYHLGLEPTRKRTPRAIRLCRLQYSTASANIIPPRNIIFDSYIKIIFKIKNPFTINNDITFMYAMQTSPVSIIPKRGKRTTGIKLVMGNGRASVIQ